MNETMQSYYQRIRAEEQRALAARVADAYEKAPALPALDEARRNALKQARARADMYAQSLGMRVRRIVSISEGARIDMLPPMPMASMRMEKAMADTPVAPGENVLTANLDVVFELGQ